MIPIIFLLHPSFWMYASQAFQNAYPYGMAPYAGAAPQQAPGYPMPGQPYMGTYPPPAQAYMPYGAVPTAAPDKQQLLQLRQYLLDQLKQIEESLSAIDKAEKGKKG